MFALQGEPLQPFVGAIGNHNRRLTPRTIVNPYPMRCIELAVSFPRLAEHGFPIPILIVTMDAERAVTVREKEPAIGQEGIIGRHKRIAAPSFGGFGILALGI